MEERRDECMERKHASIIPSSVLLPAASLA